MSSDFEKTVVTNDNLPKLLSKWTRYLKDSEPESLFDGMSNNDIKEQTFGEKVYQLDSLGFVTMGLIPNVKDNKLFLTSNFNNGTNIDFGYVDMDEDVKSALDQKYNLTLIPQGGKYKQVITDEDGTQSVKQFFEPVSLKLRFTAHLKNERKTTAKQENNQTITPQEMQRRVANGKKEADNDQALGGCLGMVGLIGGFAFFVSGYPIIGIAFFLILFAGSIYSLMPH
ncbi:hypothetical protein [Companilactobacillus farciminis]|uniref:hypothetical protein n=1 Tax=Companilactobacillus farciminis TaxID=1612 RepID=UPI00232BDE75|nr:hypothetical protein [Companilactobacillus farciminis]WCG36368.1 hypothetical protein PML84_04145 [Companilactobacillus farciminis]